LTGRVLSVRGYNAFQALARSHDRARNGPVRVNFCPVLEGEYVSVAYAISRKVGGAVARNRCRRRLRSIVAQVAEDLRPGDYLVGVRVEAIDMDFSELQERLVEAMRNASGLK
jgi:ribonuclease P protein component